MIFVNLNATFVDNIPHYQKLSHQVENDITDDRTFSQYLKYDISLNPLDLSHLKSITVD